MLPCRIFRAQYFEDLRSEFENASGAVGTEYHVMESSLTGLKHCERNTDADADLPKHVRNELGFETVHSAIKP